MGQMTEAQKKYALDKGGFIDWSACRREQQQQGFRKGESDRLDIKTNTLSTVSSAISELTNAKVSRDGLFGTDNLQDAIVRNVDISKPPSPRNG